MIKVDRSYSSESYWRNDDFCDNKRNKRFTVRIFGIKVFSRVDHYEAIPGNPLPDKNNGIGFKK